LALNLDLNFKGVHHTTLSYLRDRLLGHDQSDLAMELIGEGLQAIRVLSPAAPATGRVREKTNSPPPHRSSRRAMPMTKLFILLTLLCASLSVQVTTSYGASPDGGQPILPGPATPSVNPVLQWNRTLLGMVRSPGAQPATIHPTRSFAILHAAIYDAVNAIDRTHRPYLVRLTAISRHASQDAAAAAAGHEVLVKLYPKFQSTLDVQLQQSLAQVPDGAGKVEGINLGQAVADRILALRSQDQSDAQPLPFVFGHAPGDYQSTPPNFSP